MPEMRAVAPRNLSALDVALFVAIGALEGLLWYGVVPEKGPWAATRVGVSLAAFFTAAALVGRFTWTGAAIGRWGATAGALGAVVGGVTWWVLGQQLLGSVRYGGDDVRTGSWFLGAFVFLYVLTPFAQIHQRSGEARFPYPQLFEHSWNNFFVGVVGALFAGVLWALLALWGALFKLVGIDFFADLFGSRPFAFAATFTAFGYGLAIGRSSEGVIATLRRITLLIARVLLPLIALVVILFALTLPFTGLEPLWKTGSTTPLLLSLLAFVAVLLNAVFEDGEQPAPYSAPLRRGIEAAALLMPVFAAIAANGSWQRVSQHGLTPDRVYALVFVAIAAVYAVGYSAAVLWRRGGWLSGLRPVNVATALLVAAVAILLQLPVLDPMRLSAEQQVRRLLRGEVPVWKFDFAALRFRLGHYGEEALARLERAQGPDAQAIRASIADVRGFDNESSWKTEREKRGERGPFEWKVAPVGLQVPDEVSSAVRTWLAEHDADCDAGTSCLLIGANLDADGALEFCVLTLVRQSSACFASDGNSGWRSIGTLHYSGKGYWPDADEVARALEEKREVLTQPSRYREIVVPRGALMLVPE